MSLRLFNKREIFFRGLELSGANLDQIAAVVAKALHLPEQEVLVVDARADLLTIDILNAEVEVERIAGRGPALLQALAQVPGVRLGAGRDIHSEGVLGLVNLPVEEEGSLRIDLNA